MSPTEFNRYAPKPIEVTTPALRDLQISGVFTTDDTEIHRILAQPQGVHVEVTESAYACRGTRRRIGRVYSRGSKKDTNVRKVLVCAFARDRHLRISRRPFPRRCAPFDLRTRCTRVPRLAAQAVEPAKLSADIPAQSLARR